MHRMFYWLNFSGPDLFYHIFLALLSQFRLLLAVSVVIAINITQLQAAMLRSAAGATAGLRISLV
jgi:hypothetical protein